MNTTTTTSTTTTAITTTANISISEATYLLSPFPDKPENVRLVTTASANKACQNDVVNFTCSADAKPQASYQLFSNDMPKENSSTGMWSKTLPDSGTFTYKCVANNIVGSVTSTSVNVTVNGN